MIYVFRKDWLASSCFLLSFPTLLQAAEINLSIEDMQGSAFQARAISAVLHGKDLSNFTARIGELSVQNKNWKNVSLTCPKVRIEKSFLECARGALQNVETIPMSFRYDTLTKQIDMTLSPTASESWRVLSLSNKGILSADVTIKNGRLSQVSTWLPESLPKFKQGTVTGKVTYSGQHKGMQITTDLNVKNATFSDVAGLRAGEKVDVSIKGRAVQVDAAWQWNADFDWQKGEVFWQPLYFAKGGHPVNAQGTFEAGLLRVTKGQLQLAEIGAADVSGVWNTTKGNLDDFDLAARNLNLGPLYTVLLKPLMEKTAFASLTTKGHGDIIWRYRNHATQRFDMQLRDADIEDVKQRFAFYGIHASIPWVSDAPSLADIRIRSSKLQQLPLGEVHIPLRMNGFSFDVAEINVPILDGALTIEGFHAASKDGAWRWAFNGGLKPVSMERLTATLKLPSMPGRLSGVIPRVSYVGDRVTIDGALLLNVFDGTVVVKDLVLIEPFGTAARLTANLDMRNLNLDQLTRTFSFGNIEGRMDVQVSNLELANWKPVQFDAMVASSPGDYPRKISQKAVQNISALGGAGAVAALQRSFLSFFERFGYEKIGLSCRLRNDVCLMDGVEPAPQGYVIVKGGGIPAITVIGYNRYVKWQELLDRVARITQDNVKPVIQ